MRDIEAGKEAEIIAGAGDPNSVSPASGVANMLGRAESQLRKQQMLQGNFGAAALWKHEVSKKESNKDVASVLNLSRKRASPTKTPIIRLSKKNRRDSRVELDRTSNVKDS